MYAGAVASHAGHQGFQFQRRREPIVLDNGTVNVGLAATYRGGAWTTISVDIARAEPGEAEAELLDAVAFEDALGIIGPARVPCLPLRYQMAQKLHGMTLPSRHGKRNERFKDLIDLMLTEALERVRAMVARILAASYKSANFGAPKRG